MLGSVLFVPNTDGEVAITPVSQSASRCAKALGKVMVCQALPGLLNRDSLIQHSQCSDHMFLFKLID